MHVPNAENAFIDLRKILTYCLDPTHNVGKHKAKVFLSALGLDLEDADELSKALIFAVQNIEADAVGADEFGQRYVLNFEMERKGQKATIRSVWIIETNTDFPRLVTCFVV